MTSKKELTDAIRTLTRIAGTPSGKQVDIYLSGATISSRDATVYLNEDLGPKAGLIEAQALLGALKEASDPITDPFQGLATTDSTIKAHQPENSAPVVEVDLERAKQVIVACGDQLRPILSHLAVSEQGLAATDSYRMFLDSQEKISDEAPRLVPAAVVKALRGPSFQLLGKGKNLTVIGETAQGARVVANLNLTYGNYPRIDQILGLSNPKITIDLDAEAATAACQKIVKDGDKNGTAVLKLTGTELRLGQGKIKAQVIGSFSAQKDSEMEIGINPQFFQSAVKFIGPGAELKIEGPLRALTLNGKRRTALMMPIRIEA